jgi:hypothetical protein
MSQFLLGTLSSRDFPKNRIRNIAKGINSKQPCTGFSVLLWNNKDQQLQDLFGIGLESDQ